MTYSTGNHKPTVNPKHISLVMEHQGNELPLVGSSAQMAYGANLYQGNPMTITSSQVPTGSTVSAQTAGLSPSPAQMAQQHLAYQQLHQQQQLQQQLQSFWASQIENLDHITDFKNHSLPLARIKKIMKADEDVRMISAEAPVLFARACELFILELTLCAWNHTEENKRRTLQRNDIAAAITRTEIFDFLIDIVPREDSKDEVLASMSAGPVRVGAPAEGVPYYYMPPPAPPVGAPGMTVGQPVDPSLYGQHPHPYMAQHMWPQEQAQPPTDS